MKNVKDILDSLASPTQSKWREKAEWRRANRHWLRKSQKIALTILESISSKKMTQKELSEQMGVSAQYISRILKGSENLSLETISKLENVLGIEIISVNSYSTQQTIMPMWQKLTDAKFESSTETELVSMPMSGFSSYLNSYKQSA